MEKSRLEVQADRARPWFPGYQFPTTVLDDVLWYPKPDDVERLLRDSWLEKYRYLVRKFDCDKYARILWAFVTQELYRTLEEKGLDHDAIFPWAFGFTLGTFRHVQGYHACNMVSTTEGLYVVEPQTDQLRLPDPVLDRPRIDLV